MGTSTGQNEPHPPPTLQITQGSNGRFDLRKADTGQRDVIKLSVEFSLKIKGSINDVSLFFKRFLTVLLAANMYIQVLKWEASNENLTSKAVDVAYHHATIAEYYTGMKLTNRKNSIMTYLYRFE